MRLNFNDLALRHMAITLPAVKEGRLLYRDGAKSNDTYKERWFKLHANLLFYFKTNGFGALGDIEPIGVLVIVGHQVQMEMYSDRPFVFSISFSAGDQTSGTTKLYFSGQSLEHCRGWVNALTDASHETLQAKLTSLRQRIQQKTGQDPLVWKLPRPKPAKLAAGSGQATFYETGASMAAAGVYVSSFSSPKVDKKRATVPITASVFTRGEARSTKSDIAKLESEIAAGAPVVRASMDTWETFN